MAIDGREDWTIHNFLYRGEDDFNSVDRDWAIRMILGAGPDFQYEVIAKEDWISRRLVADKFRDRRVFICGDAAHVWIPAGGYGMNAGIADAANLSWMIIEQLIGTVIRCQSYDKIDSAGANKALHLLGLHLGMFVERKETGKPGEFDGLSITDKRERIIGIARELGLNRISIEERLPLSGPVIEVEGETHDS